MGPKWSFQVLSKVSAWNFSEFLGEVTAAKIREIDTNDFFENKFFEVLGAEGPKMRPKWGFSGIIKICTKLQLHKGWKLGETYFGKIIALRFLGVKKPKLNRPKMRFMGNGRKHHMFLIFWMFFFGF